MINNDNCESHLLDYKICKMRNILKKLKDNYLNPQGFLVVDQEIPHKINSIQSTITVERPDGERISLGVAKRTHHKNYHNMFFSVCKKSALVIYDEEKDDFYIWKPRRINKYDPQVSIGKRLSRGAVKILRPEILTEFLNKLIPIKFMDELPLQIQGDNYVVNVKAPKDVDVNINHLRPAGQQEINKQAKKISITFTY